MAKRRKIDVAQLTVANYEGLVGDISELLEQARRTAAKTINSILTATYWEMGRRIVEHEQGGQARAEYGEGLLKRLATDLTAQFGRGFAWRNLFYLRSFFLGWEILQTPSAIFEARVKLPAELLSTADAICPTPSNLAQILQTLSAKSQSQHPADFPLSWSRYVRLMSVEKPHARAFYEAEAIRGGWSVRNPDSRRHPAEVQSGCEHSCFSQVSCLAIAWRRVLTHSDLKEFATSLIAASVLAEISAGEL